MGHRMPERPYTIKIKEINWNRQGTHKRAKTLVKKTWKKLAPYLYSLINLRKASLFGQVGSSKLDMLKILFSSWFEYWPLMPFDLNDVPSFPRQKNEDLRTYLASLLKTKGCDPFFQTVLSTVPCNMPRVYLEGFLPVRDYALKCCKMSPKAIIDSMGWFVNEPFKFLAAEKAEKGTILVGVQHGGQYGIGKYSPSEEHEISVTDLFLSWGWKKGGNNKVRPVPQPNLSHLRKKAVNCHFADKGPILHVSNIFPRYLEFFRSVPIGPQVETYLEDQYIFIRTLPIRIRKRLIFRPYPVDEYGWQQHRQFIDLYPEVLMDDYSKSFLERVEECRLVVCSDLQTTFLEAIVRNVPTILYIDRELWKIRAEALPYIEELNNPRL